MLKGFALALKYGPAVISLLQALGEAWDYINQKIEANDKRITTTDEIEKKRMEERIATLTEQINNKLAISMDKAFTYVPKNVQERATKQERKDAIKKLHALIQPVIEAFEAISALFHR